MSSDATHEEVAEVRVDGCNISPLETDVVDVPSAVSVSYYLIETGWMSAVLLSELSFI